jgi:glycerol-1-phosphate dehydrogenase [NAD(P)+]
MMKIDRWDRFKHIINHIDVSDGALENVPKWVSQAGFKRPLVVADVNTYAVAGGRLCRMLDGDGLGYDLFTYFDEKLVGDETAVGKLTAAYDPKNDLFIAVGSGTVNDLCKYVGYKVNRPVIAVGTAPSMDGYASKGAAMTIGGMKVTPQTICPLAIFCDLSVMKDAPTEMLAAGLGDVLGKLNALADWKLSRLLTGEPMPLDIAGLVEESVEKCIGNIEGLARREVSAVEDVTEALILSGIAMSLYGDSRPASGSEHHLSHYWEMRFIAEGREPILHGLKVGVATLVMLGLWKDLSEKPRRPKLEDRARTVELIKQNYGTTAEGILKTENPNLPFEFIMENWAKIREIADSVPEPATVCGWLKKLGAPLSPEEIGVNGALLADSILLARERKKVYTLLQLLGDLGML